MMHAMCISTYALSDLNAKWNKTSSRRIQKLGQVLKSRKN